MANNKFATMVHKNTNELTLILVYVVLEWALIFMLLLNALLSYLILKFSQFFGLKAPCILCSRIDHVFEPNNKKNSLHTDLLCEVHVRRISNLGPCSSENCSRIDNQARNNVKEFDDNNLEKFIVFECSEMKGNQYYDLLSQTKTCDFVSHHTRLDSLTEECHIPMNKSEDDVSIGTEIPDIELTEEFHQEACIKEDNQGTKQVEEDVVVLKTISIDAISHQKTLGLELNDMDEEKLPNTSSSLESLHHVYKNLLLVEKKDSGMVESFDGTLTTDFKDGESMSTENLMLALEAKRKVLNDLYTELEEERSANAIAANQTMAMINRLQEEKAMMQMEALHYQRMMEEQSQYDQETLEFFNELITKTEKEKQELERELGVYKARVIRYEVNETLNKVEKESDNSSLSSSNFGDTDVLSIEDDGEDSFHENKDQNTPIEAILCLDEFDKLEEEKLLILHQVKHSKEKLFAREDNKEGKYFEVVEAMDHTSKENGYHIVKQCGTGNGLYMETYGKHEEGKRINGLIAKRLFPLFQATENGHVAQNGSPVDRIQQSVSECIESNKKNLNIEEE